MPHELPTEVHERIVAICKNADNLTDEDNYVEAVKEYWNAWRLLPEPQYEWKAATWILGSIGNACFHGKRYEQGRNALQSALLCPDGIGNPFIHLRLGQIYYELNQLDLAADELIRAYMAKGKDIFKGELKYYDFLKTRADIE